MKKKTEGKVKLIIRLFYISLFSTVASCHGKWDRGGTLWTWSHPTVHSCRNPRTDSSLVGFFPEGRTGGQPRSLILLMWPLLSPPLKKLTLNHAVMKAHHATNCSVWFENHCVIKSSKSFQRSFQSFAMNMAAEAIGDRSCYAPFSVPVSWARMRKERDWDVPALGCQSSVSSIRRFLLASLTAWLSALAFLCRSKEES